MSLVIFALSCWLFLPLSAGEIHQSDPALKPQNADSSEHVADSLQENPSVKTHQDNPLPADIVPPTQQYITASADSSWWYRKVENRAFGVGEKLEFAVKYGVLPAGSAVMEIAEIVEYDGYPCYRVVSVAKSNDVVSVFYKVRDSVETIVDVDGIFSRKFWKRLREGGYRTERTTFFDQRAHLAISGKDTISTYPFVQDPFSSLYFVRTQDFKPGDSLLIDSHTDKKNYPLKVMVYRREKVQVPAGEFDCLVVEPMMRTEGIFKAKGRIWIWLTDDQYKMPVMMKTEVFFLGSITARLSKYTRGKVEG